MSPLQMLITVTKTSCHYLMMTWRSICPCSFRYALVDGLVAAARLSYDTPPNRVIFTLVAGRRTTGNAVNDDRMSRSLPEVATRRAFEPKAVAPSRDDALLQKRMISGPNIPNIRPKGPLITYEQDVEYRSALQTIHNQRQLIMNLLVSACITLILNNCYVVNVTDCWCLTAFRIKIRRFFDDSATAFS